LPRSKLAEELAVRGHPEFPRYTGFLFGEDHARYLIACNFDLKPKPDGRGPQRRSASRKRREDSAGRPS